MLISLHSTDGAELLTCIDMQRPHDLQDNSDPSVAFTVLVKRDGNDPSDGQEGEETLVNVTHDAVTGAVQDVRRFPFSIQACSRSA